MDVSPHVYLASNRLALIGVGQDGRMPFKSADGKIWLILNGTIYNYRFLKEELKAQGHSFATQTDTEVVLQSYVRWGPSFVDKLNGVFSFVLVDLRARKAYLARDRFGAKPLFYRAQGDYLCASSELSPLCAFFDTAPLEFDRGALTAYMACRFVPGQRTILKGIFKVRPGEICSVDLGSLCISTRTYWEPRYSPSLFDQAEFDDKLQRALRMTRRADVACLHLLSGGLDSSLVSAIAREQEGDSVESIAFAFHGSAGQSADYAFTLTGHSRDERDQARTVADHLSLRHEDAAFGENLTEDMFVEMQRALGEPIASPNALGVFLSARSLCGRTKVVISGTGADELLGGYAGLYFGSLGKDLTSRTSEEILSSFSDYDGGPASALDLVSPDFCDLNYLHTELHALARNIPADAYPVELLNQLAVFEMLFPLPGWELDQADRLFMRYGIEARSAFLENEFVDYCLGIPSALKVDKAPLRTAARGRLPADTVAQPKYPSLGTPDSVMTSSWYQSLQDSWQSSTDAIWHDRIMSDLGRGGGAHCSADVLFRAINLDSWCRNVLPAMSL